MDAVKVKIENALMEVTIDRPKANAIDLATSRHLGETFAAFRDNPELRVAIITGGAGRFFSAGWDLKAAAAGEAVDVRLRSRRLRRPTRAARPQQTGHRRHQRHGGRRRLRNRPLLRPHPRRRIRLIQPAGNQRRHPCRRRHHQTAAPHPPPHRHGPPPHRPLAQRRRSAPLGPRQRNRRRRPTHGTRPRHRPPVGLRTAARLRRHQRNPTANRKPALRRRHAKSHTTAATDSRRPLRQRRPP